MATGSHVARYSDEASMLRRYCVPGYQCCGLPCAHVPNPAVVLGTGYISAPLPEIKIFFLSSSLNSNGFLPVTDFATLPLHIKSFVS